MATSHLRKVIKFTNPFLPNERFLVHKLLTVPFQEKKASEIYHPLHSTVPWVAVLDKHDLNKDNIRSQKETLLRLYQRKGVRYEESSYARVDVMFTPRLTIHAFDVSSIPEKGPVSNLLLSVLNELYTTHHFSSTSCYSEIPKCFVATALCDDFSALSLLQTLGYRLFVEKDAPTLLGYLQWKCFHQHRFPASHAPLTAGRIYGEQNTSTNKYPWLPFIKFPKILSKE